METEILRAELERLFELEELTGLSQRTLGFDPESVGGNQALGSFARALTEYCQRHDAIEALCDAIWAKKGEVSEKVAQLRLGGCETGPEVAPGAKLGPYLIKERVGDGRVGLVYQASKDGVPADARYRVKVLRTEARRDLRGLQRYLTLTRLVGEVEHPGLPREVFAGEFDGIHLVAHRLEGGQTLAERTERTGPTHITEARSLLVSLLEALAALHERRLSHGNLRLSNVIVGTESPEARAVFLVDAGGDRLRVRPRVGAMRDQLFSTSASALTASPEQIQGLLADASSDVYSFGAVAYHFLTGSPVFEGGALDAAFGHLRSDPQPPSTRAPEGWVGADLDAFILRLLRKEPADRPKDAGQVLEEFHALFETLTRRSTAPYDEEALARKIAALLEAPEDTELALQLEALPQDGAPIEKVGGAFVEAAKATDDVELKLSLLFRAARLYESSSSTNEAAETTYRQLTALKPEDEVAAQGLERSLGRAKKFEELVELLLDKNDRSDSAIQRARTMAEIGRIYAEKLGDREQAVVALTQAFSEEPDSAKRALELEQVAKGDEQTWIEILESLGQAAADEATPEETRVRLYERMGTWYGTMLSRSDLALPCFQAVLAKAPANDVALCGLTEIYRQSQQWNELGMTLSTRANAAPPPLARELRAEAAEILYRQLNDVGGARDMYEQIITDDPGHEKAAEALAQIYERAEDFAPLAKLLENRIQAQKESDHGRLLCQLAEIYDTRLGEPMAAMERYRAALELDGNNLDALRGLDAVYSKTGEFELLLDNLRTQMSLAATPKQKIGLLERIAGIHEEEFLDHAQAADALEEILRIDEARASALSRLMPHYRALDRWEDVSSLYERQLKLASESSDRVDLCLAWGRVLMEQIGSAERATKAFELVLESDPEHPQALEALAKLRESTGDADAALDAILALAHKATAPEAKAQQHVRAAKLLESRGMQDAAIDQYKLALDANPRDRGVNVALREAYLSRGEVNAALSLLEREIQATEGDRAKAKLAGEMAVLAREELKDDKRAGEAAKRALNHDPINVDARVVLGDIAFEEGHMLEAAKHFEAVADRTDTMDKERAVRILVRYVDSLSKTGSTEKALAPMDTLKRLAPDDMVAMERVAFVTFEHGSPARTTELYEELIRRFGKQLPETSRAQSYYRYGESLRRMGKHQEAVAPLEEAADLDPRLTEPLVSLALVHTSLENYQEAIKTKTRQLDIADSDTRVELLVSIGDLAAEKLEDRTQAAKNYVAALDERPNDRRLLTKLMQLYSDEKDWNKLIEVVLKLAQFVDEPDQKAKYLQTAGMLSARQVGDADRALKYYGDALSLAPSIAILIAMVELERGRGGHDTVEELLKQKLDIATREDNREQMLATFVELALLYEKDLGDLEGAIDAYEAAQTLEQDSERAEKLMDLYADDPEKHLDRAVAIQGALLEEDPFRHDSYKRLRRLYTETKRADASWCLCQTLSVLKLAEPDEERFYKRMRSDIAAAAQTVLRDEDWLEVLMHRDADPLLTSVCALIEPAVLMARGQTPEELGYHAEHRMDLATHYASLVQNLYFAAGVMGMEVPVSYENVNDPGGLAFLHTHEPSVVVGSAALSAEIPPQAAAFIAARHMAYLRPGLYLRQLISSGTVLKSWIFAAIKLTAPAFPVAKELEGPVNEALEGLKASVTGEARDQLTRAVSKLLQSGASLDLKRWIAGIDLTADRAGFVVAHDLATAVDIIRASDETASAAGEQDRFKELISFSVSAPYFELRKRLGIAIDS